jgi:transposase
MQHVVEMLAKIVGPLGIELGAEVHETCPARLRYLAHDRVALGDMVERVVLQLEQIGKIAEDKTDRNDALGIAQMMRVGLFKPVHVKTPASQQRRLLLTARKLLQRKVNDIENDLRGQLRNFGLKVGMVRSAAFEQRVRELVADMPCVTAVIIPRWMRDPRCACSWQSSTRCY